MIGANSTGKWSWIPSVKETLLVEIKSPRNWETSTVVRDIFAGGIPPFHGIWGQCLSHLFWEVHFWFSKIWLWKFAQAGRDDAGRIWSVHRCLGKAAGGWWPGGFTAEEWWSSTWISSAEWWDGCQRRWYWDGEKLHGIIWETFYRFHKECSGLCSTWPPKPQSMRVFPQPPRKKKRTSAAFDFRWLGGFGREQKKDEQKIVPYCS